MERNFSVPIAPVSNWRLLARRAIQAGIPSVGEFILLLACQLVYPPPKAMAEITEEYTSRDNRSEVYGKMTRGVN